MHDIDTPMDPEKIEQRILQAMPGARVTVTTEDRVHYSARIVSDRFVDLNRVKRHRLVHAAIGPELGHEIHALSLELKTPDEAAG